MAAILGLIGGAGMVFTVGRTAYTYDDDATKTEAALKSALTANETTKAQIDQIVNDQGALDAKIIDEIDTGLKNIISLQNALAEAKANAARRFFAIQLSGVIFISLILFLYILKAFGFLHDINSWFYGLFSGGH